MGVEHLIEETAYFLFPFFAVFLQIGNRLMLIHEDEAVRPPVLDRHFSEPRQNARVGLHREAVQRDDLDKLIADHRHDAGVEFLPTNQAVNVHGRGRKVDRMVFAGNAEMQPAQEIVLGNFHAVFQNDFMGAKTVQLQGNAQVGFQIRTSLFEMRECAVLLGAFTFLGVVVIKHQFGDLFFCQ